MDATIEVITPQKARDYLARNAGNRALRPSWVDTLRLVIQRGEWKLSHQGIALAPDGRLLDGQHRLSAIVAAGRAVPMWVFRNVSPDAFAAMDRGNRRTLADVTREDRRVIETTRVLAQIMTGKSPRGVTDGFTIQVLDACRAEVTEVCRAISCSNSKRTSAPIRAAAALRIMLGTDRAYVLKLLDAFARMMDGLPPVCMSLLRQMDSGAVGSRMDKWDLLARALIMFDPSKRIITRIQVNSVDAVLQEAAAVLRQRVEAAATTLSAGRACHE